MRRWLFAGLLMMTTPILAAEREYSLDLWDWTAPCRDLTTFKIWAKDLKSIGVNRVEISVPWNLLEPEPGKYDLSFISDRLSIATELGLGMRLRINSYWGGATPAWLKADLWCDINGNAPEGTPRPVSIRDERFWERFEPLCTAIAKSCRGKDVLFSPFIGVHAELKFADWWTYDDASLKLWRKSINTPRPDWLRNVVDDSVELPQTPPIPPKTHGTPDTSPASLAFIAFREHCWRVAVERFDKAIHAGDPDAKTSAPLGESFRSQSAQFSNQDYFGLSRGCVQVVHSYDFFWHPQDGAWQAGAAVASFAGITGLPVVFEFDGPDLMERLNYTQAQLEEIADAAIEQGAGLKMANYSYSSNLPSTFPILKALGAKISQSQSPVERKSSDVVLLFVSKWANYCYREPTEWLHDAQFGAWKMLRSQGQHVRVIFEDNLDEDLSGYKGIYVAFSPPQLLPRSAREKLSKLTGMIPSIVELTDVPAGPPTNELKDFEAKGPQLVMNSPLAYAWLRAKDRTRANEVLKRAIDASWR